MAEQSESAAVRRRLQSNAHLLRGAVGGFVAAAVMAVVIGLLDLAWFERIATLYLQNGNALIGAAVHLVHGTMFGVLFALVLSDPGLYSIEDQPAKSVVAGLVFGFALAVTGAGIIMPIWLNVLGANETLSVPYVTGPIVVYHLVYGTVLGGIYALEHT